MSNVVPLCGPAVTSDEADMSGLNASKDTEPDAPSSSAALFNASFPPSSNDIP